MKTTMKTTIVLLSIFLLTVVSGYAQQKRYPYVQDGKIIVCREGNDGVISTLIHPNWTTTPSHDETDAANNRFAAKFEVAAASAVGNNGKTWPMSWFEATGTLREGWNPNGYSACAQYSEAANQSDKGSWRLPTARELRLIHALLNELTSVNMPSERHWSTTESSSKDNIAMTVAFGDNDGEIYGGPKTSDAYYTRCVRDI